MHVPRAICGGCGRELEIEQTGIAVEMMAAWGSYYKIYGDKFTCTSKECNEKEIDTSVVLLSTQPIAMHFDESYDNYTVQVHGSFLY